MTPLDGGPLFAAALENAKQFTLGDQLVRPHSGSALLASICALAMLASGCGRDLPTELPLPNVASGAVITGLGATMASGRLEVSLANVNQCDEGEAVRDPSGKFLRWNYTRKHVQAYERSAGPEVAEYRIIYFGSDGKQSEDIRCILKTGKSADNFVKNYIASRRGGVSTFNGFNRVNISPGTFCAFTWYGVNCEGTECYLRNALRAPSVIASTIVPDWERVGGPLANAVGAAYECDDGDWLRDEGEWFSIHSSDPRGGGGGPSATITVACSPAEPTRKSTTTCTATASGATWSTSAWRFIPSSSDLGVRNESSGAMSWGGPMVASGTIRVTGTLGGITDSAEAWVYVQPRSGFASGSFSFTNPPIGQGSRPAVPTVDEHLGITSFSVLSPTSTYTVPGSGPNNGYTVLEAAPGFQAAIEINGVAMQAGSTFYNNHPATPTGSYCLQPYIVNTLKPKVEAHEGTAWDAQSHAAVWRGYIDGGSLFRTTLEQIVGMGSISVFRIESELASPLVAAANFADHPNVPAVQLTCTIKY